MHNFVGFSGTGDVILMLGLNWWVSRPILKVLVCEPESGSAFAAWDTLHPEARLLSVGEKYPRRVLSASPPHSSYGPYNVTCASKQPFLSGKWTVDGRMLRCQSSLLLLHLLMTVSVDVAALAAGRLEGSRCAQRPCCYIFSHGIFF